MPYDAMTDDTDDALLAAYGRGDARAARLLTRRLAPLALAHAQRMLGGDRAEAEDVAQDALLRLWRAAPNWEPGKAKVSTWLYRVTANLCIDRLRKARTDGLDAIAEPEDPGPSVPQAMQQAARADALQKALNCLPERQRQAVILRHIEGMGNDDIAAIMDIGTRAVESLTARGKRQLTTLLAGKKAELGYQDDD